MEIVFLICPRASGVTPILHLMKHIERGEITYLTLSQCHGQDSDLVF
jgi:hypothetical protein